MKCSCGGKCNHDKDKKSKAAKPYGKPAKKKAPKKGK